MASCPPSIAKSQAVLNVGVLQIHVNVRRGEELHDDFVPALLRCVHQSGVAFVVHRIHVNSRRGEELPDGFGKASLGCDHQSGVAFVVHRIHGQFPARRGAA